MRVQKAQAAQSGGACPASGKLGDVDAVGLADKYKAYPALAVQEQAYLAFQGAGKKRKFPGLIQGIEFLCRELACAETLQGLELTGPESLKVSFKTRNGRPPR